jgi:hypothetical protein
MWPVEEIGRNSVIPSTIAMMIAWSIDMKGVKFFYPLLLKKAMQTSLNFLGIASPSATLRIA